MFEETEYSRLGDTKVIDRVLTLCHDIWQEIKDHMMQSKEVSKWDGSLLKDIQEQTDRIKDDMDKSVKSRKLKDIVKIQKKAMDLKYGRDVLFLCYFKLIIIWFIMLY